MSDFTSLELWMTIFTIGLLGLTLGMAAEMMITQYKINRFIRMERKLVNGIVVFDDYSKGYLRGSTETLSILKEQLS